MLTPRLHLFDLFSVHIHHAGKDTFPAADAIKRDRE
jgi:hypothetical protein